MTPCETIDVLDGIETRVVRHMAMVRGINEPEMRGRICSSRLTCDEYARRVLGEFERNMKLRGGNLPKIYK